ncbi:MAG: hypothetical protein AAF961_10175, partial [Planctomycetota bacterium]
AFRQQDAEGVTTDSVATLPKQSTIALVVGVCVAGLLRRRSIRGATRIGFALLILAAVPSAGWSASLISGNAEATVADEFANLTVWNVDGGPDNVFLANFFFRTDTLTSDNGGEVRIDGLGAVTQTPLGDAGVRFEASDGILTAEQTWTLTGGDPGSGDAAIEAAITLTNISTAPVTLEVFYAADLDIAFDQANPNDETTVLSDSDNLMTDPVTLAQIATEVSPSADAYQVYEGQFEVLFNFNSDVDGATTLNDTPAIGVTVIDEPNVTDAGFAYGWSIELMPGGSVSAGANHVHAVIPEPATLSLLAISWLFVLVPRRPRRG